ncbi:hypothetical protein [Hydrogenimonas sp.]
MRWLLMLILAVGAQATSHCYKQRSNCFVVKDGKDDVKMYIKRDRFVEVAKKHGISKERIKRMIKKGEGRSEESNENRRDLRDERGYYGGVYWPHPIYAHPPYHYPPYHDHPDRPGHGHPPHEGKPPQKPTHGPITIQPTENPAFNRPGRPSTQPVQRPTTKPVQRPQTRPVTRPQRPAARPRPRPRPIRRAR